MACIDGENTGMTIFGRARASSRARTESSESWSEGLGEG
jgi:hypothetical protein